MKCKLSTRVFGPDSLVSQIQDVLNSGQIDVNSLLQKYGQLTIARGHALLLFGTKVSLINLLRQGMSYQIEAVEKQALVLDFERVRTNDGIAAIVQIRGERDNPGFTHNWNSYPDYKLIHRIMLIEAMTPLFGEGSKQRIYTNLQNSIWNSQLRHHVL